MGFGRLILRILRRGRPGGPIVPPPVSGYTRVVRGRTAGYDAGTLADFYADAVNGNDANAGTSPAQAFRTTQRLLDAAKAAGGARTVRLIGDHAYPPATVSALAGISKANPWRISSYGTGRPVITGQMIVTGWTQCSSADQAALNAGFASIYKATVQKSQLAHAAFHALLLCEADVPLDLVQARADVADLFTLDRYQTFFTGGTFGLRTSRMTDTIKRGTIANGADGLATTTLVQIVSVTQGATSFVSGTDYEADLAGNRISWVPGGQEPAAGSEYTIVLDRRVIDTLTHPAVLGQYSDAQLARMAVMAHVTPNLVRPLKVTAASNGTLQFASNEYEADTSSGGPKFSLLSALPLMGPGKWGYVDNADGTLTLYAWPRDPASLAGRMAIAAKDLALRISSSSFVRIDGVGLSMTCSDQGTEGRPLHVKQSDFTQIDNVEVFNFSHASRGYGGIVVEDSDDCEIRRTTVRNGQSCAGIFMQGYTAANQSFRNRLYAVLFVAMTQTPLRAFAQKDYAHVFTRSLRCGSGAHANQDVIYQGCDNVIVFGYEADECEDGYATSQASSRIRYVMCRIPMARDGRALYDQVGGNEPTPNGQGVVINTQFLQKPSRVSTGYAALTLGSSEGTPSWLVYNVITTSIARKDNSAATITRRCNFLTAPLPGDPFAHASETVFSGDLVDLFADAEAGDFDAAPTAPFNSLPSESVESIIAALEADFPDLNLRQDVLGRPWNPADPGVGPFGKAYPAKADGAKPVLSSYSRTLTGARATITVTTDKLGGYLHWVRLPAGALLPSVAQIVAGLDAFGAAVAHGTSAKVTARGPRNLSITGPIGSSARIAVVHLDRFGNASDVQVDDVMFTAYAPVYRSFDGGQWLKRTKALGGALPASRSALLVIGLKRSSAQLGNALGAGLLGGTPSGQAQLVDYGTTTLRAKLRNTAGTITVDHSVGSLSADVPYIFAVDYTSDATNLMSSRAVLLDGNTGAAVAIPATDTGPDAALSFAGMTTLELFKGLGMIERLMLWDAATADVSSAAVRQKLVASGGGLVDPQVLVDALGIPLVSLYGDGLATGLNYGSGGDFAIAG